MAKQDDLLDHEYDGIREYDNPTPAWWNWMWFGSFVFSVFYFFHYHMGQGVSVEEAYIAEMKTVEADRAAAAEEALKNISEGSLAELMSNATVVTKGEEVYKSNCVACHGAKGEGGIGPNLTDAFWIHGDGSLRGIHKVVYEGVVSKGMVAWSKVLPPDVLNSVVVYVGTLRGQKVPGKAPEGDEHPLP